MSGTLSTTEYVGSGAGGSSSTSNDTIVSGGVQYVGFDSGTGTATSTAISGGGYQYVGDEHGTGTATSTTIFSGGFQYVGDNDGIGTTTDVTISGGHVLASGATIYAYQYVGVSGGTGYATSTTIDTGGEQYVGFGSGTGSATSTTIVNGGFQYVGDEHGSGTATSTTIVSGGVQYVGFDSATGTATSTAISIGGSQYVGDEHGTGTATSTTIFGGGFQYVGASGKGTATDTFVSGGSQFVSLGGTADHDIIYNGLADVLSGGVVNTPIIDGGTLQLDAGAVVGSQPIDFAAPLGAQGGTLNLAGEGLGSGFTSNFTAAISGFTGTGANSANSDMIEVEGAGPADKVVWSQSGGSGALYVETSGGTSFDSMKLDGTYFTSQFVLSESGSDDQIFYDTSLPCYCAGTRIATDRGEVEVEALSIGDLVVTAAGERRPVVWIGHRNLDIRRHPTPALVTPVRVRAGALGEGLPRRDLWLSPGHNIAINGALAPIFLLINGHSVAQIEREHVVYWHVELEAHDILLAEGVPAESYLDCGNRTAFVNGGAFIEAHPDFAPRRPADTCLPLIKGGLRVVQTKARLIARLVEQGHEINSEAGAHVVVDGLHIEPTRLSQTLVGFELPDGGQKIALRSRTFIPAHTVAASEDLRELGLCVGRLQIDGKTIALEGDEFCGVGWHEAEYAGKGFAHRWTNGAAPLPAGARKVLIDLAGDGYYWRAPADRGAGVRDDVSNDARRATHLNGSSASR
jgi:autotransporter passenger strand-loop-strand repeat protein